MQGDYLVSFSKDIILGSDQEGGLGGEVIQTLSSQNKRAIVKGLMQLLGKWHLENDMYKQMAPTEIHLENNCWHICR